MNSSQDILQRITGYGKNLTEMPHAGLSTFFRADFTEDWEKVDIGLIGVPTDAGLSHRSGARYGPQSVRAQSGLIRYINPMTKVIPYEHARIADLGDVPIYNVFDLQLLNDEITAFYERIVEARIVPLSVGGDHSISYPILRALGKKRAPALIHFDSHLDMAPPLKGTKFHHGAPFRNAIEDGVIDAAHSVQVAIRDPYWELTIPFAKEAGVTVLEMTDVDTMGVVAVVETIRSVVGDRPVYLSFDIDAIDPTLAPGTGTPVMGGLTTREAMKILQGLSDLHIVGADVVEVSPPYDPTGMTALLGAQLLFEILCVTAQSSRVAKKSRT